MQVCMNILIYTCMTTLKFKVSHEAAYVWCMAVNLFSPPFPFSLPSSLPASLNPFLLTLLTFSSIPYRFLRHVPVIYVDYPGGASLRQIYGTFNRAMLRLVPNLRAYADPLTEAMVDFYTLSQVYI